MIPKRKREANGVSKSSDGDDRSYIADAAI